MWFDQRKTYDPNSFNYDTDQQELLQRQAIAKQLMNAKTPEGQMISGRYVGPGVLGHLATVLQAYIGSKGSETALADQKALDDTSQKAFREGIASYMKAQNPANYLDDVNRAAPMPQAGYTYKNPEMVGPDTAQATPVQSANIQSSPLPPGPALPKSTAPQPYGNPAASAQAPAPVVTPPPASQPEAFPQARAAQTAPASGEFDVQQPTADQVATAKANRLSVLQKAIAADKEKALDMFERSGKRGQVFSQALLAKEMTPQEMKIEKIKRGDDEVLVGVNPRNGQVTELTQGSGGESRADRKARIDEVKVWGQQREHVANAGAAVTAADTAVKSLMDAVGLAKDVGINNILGQKWEQAKSALKNNPKYTALGYIAGDGMLQAAQQMKGSMSDKDLDFIRSSRPTKDSTVAEWLAYADRVTPILQAAQLQAKKLHDGAVTTARELGIPEYQQQEGATSPGQPQTRIDWRR